MARALELCPEEAKQPLQVRGRQRGGDELDGLGRRRLPHAADQDLLIEAERHRECPSVLATRERRAHGGGRRLELEAGRIELERIVYCVHEEAFRRGSCPASAIRREANRTRPDGKLRDALRSSQEPLWRRGQTGSVVRVVREEQIRVGARLGDSSRVEVRAHPVE